jgi:hypothetical protein
MDTGFAYKVKFVDVRMRTPKEARARSKAKHGRKCDIPGCDKTGDCRAPVHPDRPDAFYWFCQTHAAEYNSRWDYFAGRSAAEIDAFQRDAIFDWGPTWSMGQGPNGNRAAGGPRSAHTGNPKSWQGAEIFEDGHSRHGFEAGSNGTSPPKTRSLPVLAARAMDELNLDHDTPATEVRARYAELVKRFHPDANKGDRATEDKLQRVIRAFKTLRAAGLA